MNLFLDLDGTLTDSREGIFNCIKFALDKMDRPHPPDTELASYIGPPLRGSFGAMLKTEDQSLIETAAAHYRERFSTLGLFENHVYPGIPECLISLRDRAFRMFVVTAKPTVFAKRIVDHFDLTPFFDDVLGSELDGHRSRKVDVIRHALEEHTLPPGNTVMVGDRQDDILGAKQMDMTSIGVLWGFGSEEELVQAGASFLCSTPDTLVDLVLEVTGTTS